MYNMGDNFMDKFKAISGTVLEIIEHIVKLIYTKSDSD